MADPFADFWGPSPGASGSPLTVQLLKSLEGFAPQAQWDKRQYSGGYGSKAQPGETFTPETATARLNQDLAPVNSWIDSNIKVPLTPEQRASLGSFGYNAGVGSLDRISSDINRGDWPTVGTRMMSFNKSLNEKTGQLEVNPGLINRRRQEVALLNGGQMPPVPSVDVGPKPAVATSQNGTTAMAMPDPQQPAGPLSNAMGGISNSFVPGIFGGGDQPGYFGKLLADPTFLMGTSVLGAGLSGRDLGTALTQGAQAATATTEMADRRRRAMTWQKLFGNGQPDVNSPILKGLPPEVLPVIQNMGPEEGMKLLGQFAMQRLAPHKLASAAPGSTVYDEQTQQPLFQAPSESPYQKELQQAQAKADVKQGQSAQAGQQMLDLTDRMISLAGPEGSEQRKTFGDATGPIQGTNWYQGIKGFVNSKAETPVVYRNLQQDLGTIKLLASRAYLSGEGQVSDNERRMVSDAVGNVESAPNADAAVQAMTNLKQIVNQVFMKPKTAAPGQPAPAGAPAMAAPAPAMPAPGGSAAPPPPGMMPPEAPPQIPGMSVTGGPPPGPAPAPQGAPPPGAGPQPGGPAPVTATGPKGEKVQLDPASGQWVPMQAPPPQPGVAPGGAPSPAVGAPADRGPFTGPRPKGPNILDRWVLRSEASRNPAIIQQYDAAFGKGAAAQILSPQQPPASSFTSQGALP